MNTTEQSTQITRAVTLRFLEVFDYLLGNIPTYGKPTLRQIALSIEMEAQHVHALRKDENRNVTVANCLRLCTTYGISANWLLLGIGKMKLTPTAEETSIDNRLKRIEKALNIGK